MAVRFDADGESYTRSTGLTTVTTFSVACWAKLAADREATTVLWQVDNGSGTNRLRINAWNGTALTFQSNSGGWFGTISSAALVVGEWTYVGFSATSNPGQARTAVRAAGSATFLGGAVGQTNITVNANTLRIGDGQEASAWLNGSLAAVKVWDQALTVEELQAESWTYRPKRTAGLRGWYPFLAPSTVDLSGAAQTLSGGSGAAADNAPPPIPWSGARRRRIVLPAGNITGTLDAALPAVTGGFDGAVTVEGQLDGQLPALTGGLDGTVTVEGQLDAALPALTGLLTGDVTSPGLLDGVLPAVTGSFQGTVTGGFLNGTLPALTGGFDGHLQISGALDATLPALTGAFTGDIEVPANDITIETRGPVRGWAAGTPTSGWAADGAARAWSARPPTT